jgi:hypothetical protein
MRDRSSISGLLIVAAAAHLCHGQAWAADASAPKGAPGERLEVFGAVIDAAGNAVAGVTIFAADASSDVVAAIAVSDAAGKVRMTLPRRRHNFGILSARLGLRRLISHGHAHFELVITPLPPNIGVAPAEPCARVDAARAFILRGRVVDETGAGIEGVRVEATRQAGAVLATAFSTTGGAFAMMVMGGETQLRVWAPGLKAVSSAFQRGRLVVVMAVVVEPQVVTITTGHVLKIKPSESIDPKYTPPANVRAWLQYAYGICPSPTPLKAYEKRGLKEYWYLDVLRREPPNPATISTVTCMPPAAYQPMPVPQTTLGGFDIWME